MNKTVYQPLGANILPKFAGPATFMRLPSFPTAQNLDACFVGVPFDLGTSNRVGTRFGPRQIRAESTPIRPYNMATRSAPFDSLAVADIGDVNINPYSLGKSIQMIEKAFDDILVHDCITLAMGGDHTITLPILRAMAKKYGPIGLIHVDAHSDINDQMNGERIAHGTPFRRAMEEGLIQPEHVVQIGLRGTGYAADDFDWSRKTGFRVVQVEECWHRSLSPLMDEVRQQCGDGPVYLSFDIDALDPSLAPGTGTLEIGGLTTIQALEIIRGCSGLKIVGADLVEVSPPYDPLGTTATIAASLLFEMLCVLPVT